MPSAPPPLSLAQPARYCVRTQGVFETRWLEMLSGVWAIRGCNGAPTAVTTLVGCVADQAALMGVLEQLYSLGFPILLVEWLVDGQDLD